MSEEKNDKDKQNDKMMKKVRLLPDFVYDALLINEGIEVNSEIIEKYEMNDEQRKNMLDLNLKIIFKELTIENLPESIEKELKTDKETASQITLDLLVKKFYLARSYFPGIDDMILKLGGRIPKEKPRKLAEQLLKREKEMEAIKEKEKAEEKEKMADTIISKPIEDLLKEFPIVGNQQIGNQKSIKLKSKAILMRPLVKYWMEDYRIKMGQYRHSNIQRVQYVYHDKNTKNMNEEERRQLNLILKSVDEKIPLPYSTRMEKIDFSKMEE
ncbi:MAG: hypothetical protein KAI71_03275 [Candidatus Pacebacteria bacterium]|nr:hypothetical protein [Candidatus Paceibacterota bacterium]